MTVSKDEGLSRALWTILRDAAALLLRMRVEGDEKDLSGRHKPGHDGEPVKPPVPTAAPWPGPGRSAAAALPAQARDRAR